MARINFEDSIWKERAFQKFMIRIGDRHKAMGMVMDLWSLAQKHWFPDRRLIPIEEFQEAELSPLLIECGLAEGRDGGIYAKGAQEHFQWLFDAQEAGKKSGEARRAKAKETQSHKPRKKKTSERPSTNLQPRLTNPEPVSTSLLSSLSSSLSSHYSNISFSNENDSAAESPPAGPEVILPNEGDGLKANRLLALYCDRWKIRHRQESSPPITGKDAGIAKRLVKSLGEEKAVAYLDAFFAMPDAWLIKAKHPLELFESKLKEIAAFAGSGEFITRREANQADDMATNMALLNKVRKGAS